MKPICFLMYMMSFFYEDYNFVKSMLDTNTRGRESGSAIINYISVRLDQIANVTDEHVDLYENRIQEHGDGVNNRLSRSISVREEDVDAGFDALSTLWRELISGVHSPKIFGGFSYYAAQLLHRREFFHVGSVDADVTVTPERTVVARDAGEILYLGKALNGCAPSAGPGTFELIFSMTSGNVSRAAVCTRDNKVVCCDIMGTNEQEERMRERVKETFISRTQLVLLEKTRTRLLNLLQKSLGLNASWKR